VLVSARGLLQPLIGVGFLSTGAWQASRVLAAAEAWRPERVADALPLYLSARAWALGLDPSDPHVLQQVFVDEGLQVYSRLFSTLYPPTAAALLSPLVAGGFGAFLSLWRPLILGVFLAGGAAAGASSAAPGRRLLGAGLGTWLAACAWPLLATSLGLGQANLLVAGLMGLALAAFGWGRVTLGAAAIALGVAIKLVPGILAWPLLVARRGRALAAAAAVVAATVVIAGRGADSLAVLGTVLDTVRFQGGVVPAWSVLPERWPLLVHALAALRHLPLMLGTLAVVAISLWRCRQPRALASAGALCVAWLAVDAAGVGVFYSLLAMPAAVWLFTWPLSPAAPRWSWPLATVVFLPWLSLPADIQGPGAELAMCAAGLPLWIGLLVRLWVETRATRTLLQRRLMAIVLLLLAVAASVQAVDRTFLRPLDPPPIDGDARQTRPEGTAPLSPLPRR